MFEKLVIKNFQKHGHLEIDLDEKVTTIVGPSDAGKSAVIRSLRWLCQNTPSGIDFLKDGAASVCVKLRLDGQEIERFKSPSNNTYSIDGAELRAFGQGVPDTVAGILNLDDINFQDQIDDPFWLKLTPGEVSRQLNALIDLSIIDETMKNINRTLSRAKVELELAEEKEKKKTVQLEEMQWVKECQMDSTVLVAAGKLLTEKKEDLEDLVSLHKELLDSFIDADQARRKLSAVLEMGKLAAHARQQRQVLDGVAGVLFTIESLQGKLQFRSVSTEAVDSAKIEADKHRGALQSLLRIREEYRRVAPLVKNKKVVEALSEVEGARLGSVQANLALDFLKRLVSETGSKDIERRQAWLTAESAQKEIEEKTKGQICPVCGKFGL